MFFIPDLFTPYIRGRQAAITDNWTDIKNYNAEAKNQLGLMEQIGTLDAKIQEQRNKADNLGLETLMKMAVFNNGVLNSDIATQMNQNNLAQAPLTAALYRALLQNQTNPSGQQPGQRPTGATHPGQTPYTGAPGAQNAVPGAQNAVPGAQNAVPGASSSNKPSVPTPQQTPLPGSMALGASQQNILNNTPRMWNP